MEKGKILIGNAGRVKSLRRMQRRCVSFHRDIELSNDLLMGKRKNVLDTAINYYYTQACQVVKGKQIADSYRRMRTKDLEKK